MYVTRWFYQPEVCNGQESLLFVTMLQALAADQLPFGEHVNCIGVGRGVGSVDKSEQ